MSKVEDILVAHLKRHFARMGSTNRGIAVLSYFDPNLIWWLQWD